MGNEANSLVLLENFRALVKDIPPLEGRGKYGAEQFAWLGKASSLVSRWNQVEHMAFGVARNLMMMNPDYRNSNFGIVMTIIFNAIASLEASLPAPTGQVFGPGAVYDFFKALKTITASAEKSLYIVDPYMDAEIFDSYLANVPRGVKIRLLVNKYGANVNAAADRFRTQYRADVDVKRSASIHDRLVFVDGSQCWVLGSSIKDAAAKKPTYIAPLSNDIVPQKLQHYEDIWAGSAQI